MKKYNIAGITFEIDLDFEVKEEDAFKEFKSKEDMKIKEVYKLIPQKFNTIQKSRKIYESPIISIFDTDEGYVREYTSIYTLKKYASLVENKNIIYYDEGQIDLLPEMFCIMELMGIELALCKHKTFILHSSYINYKGGAILFSGPSGVGKSTQANLWREYENAEIINGDRAAISKNLGSWHAYGLPFAGSSKIYKNVTLPIKAVVILRQSNENSIKKLKPVEAFKLIYSETTVNTWNKEYINNIIELIELFIVDIPIYMLNCLPDKSAVDILKKELERSEIDGR